MNLQVFDSREIAENSSEMEFRSLCEFNEGGGGVFWSAEGGPSLWEMHPDCDELLHVIEGEIYGIVFDTRSDSAFAYRRSATRRITWRYAERRRHESNEAIDER